MQIGRTAERFEMDVDQFKILNVRERKDLVTKLNVNGAMLVITPTTIMELNRAIEKTRDADKNANGVVVKSEYNSIQFHIVGIGEEHLTESLGYKVSKYTYPLENNSKRDFDV